MADHNKLADQNIKSSVSNNNTTRNKQRDQYIKLQRKQTRNLISFLFNNFFEITDCSLWSRAALPIDSLPAIAKVRRPPCSLVPSPEATVPLVEAFFGLVRIPPVLRTLLLLECVERTDRFRDETPATESFLANSTNVWVRGPRTSVVLLLALLSDCPFTGLFKTVIVASNVLICSHTADRYSWSSRSQNNGTPIV